jgi:hypothetical protein
MLSNDNDLTEWGVTDLVSESTSTADTDGGPRDLGPISQQQSRANGTEGTRQLHFNGAFADGHHFCDFPRCQVIHKAKAEGGLLL